MNPLRIVIAEDEAVIARRIARLTSEVLGPGAVALSFSTDVENTKAMLASTDADLLILDLSLEGDEGFDLLRDGISRTFETIIVSAHTDRALEAFDYGVRDFVPKPFGRQRLERALQRAIRAIRPEDPIRYLGVRRDGETHLVPIESVMYIEGAGTQSDLILRSGARLRHQKLLDRLETSLPPNFQRIHKSFIVNLRGVKMLESHEGSRYSVVLRDGTVLPVGRTRVDALRKRWE